MRNINLNYKKMKKIILAALVAVSGATIVSCEAESVTELGKQNEKLGYETRLLNTPELDSIPSNNYTTFEDGDGPGDQPFIIFPPKKKK